MKSLKQYRKKVVPQRDWTRFLAGADDHNDTEGDFIVVEKPLSGSRGEVWIVVYENGQRSVVMLKRRKARSIAAAILEATLS